MIFVAFAGLALVTLAVVSTTAFLVFRVATRPPVPPDTKECPLCTVVIPSRARVCPNCKRDLP